VTDWVGGRLGIVDDGKVNVRVDDPFLGVVDRLGQPTAVRTNVRRKGNFRFSSFVPSLSFVRWEWMEVRAYPKMAAKPPPGAGTSGEP
jgi:hypothetical protein